MASLFGHRAFTARDAYELATKNSRDDLEAAKHMRRLMNDEMRTLASHPDTPLFGMSFALPAAVPGVEKWNPVNTLVILTDTLRADGFMVEPSREHNNMLLVSWAAPR
jgi:hypothetical protein